MEIKVHGSHFESSVNKSKKSSAQALTKDTNQLSAVVKQIQQNWYLALLDQNQSIDFPYWFDDEEYHQINKNRPAVRISDLQQSLKRDQSFIIYLKGTQRYSGLLINKKRLQHFDIACINDFDKHIVDNLKTKTISNNNISNFCKTNSHKLLPAEILKHINSDLSIASIDQLCAVPFFAFINANNNTFKSMNNRNKQQIKSDTFDQYTLLSVKNFTHICNIAQDRSRDVAHSKYLSSFIQGGKKLRLQALWKTPIEVENNFLQFFYRALANSTNANTALQQAIKNMREVYGYKNLICWAGFVIVKA